MEDTKNDDGPAGVGMLGLIVEAAIKQEREECAILCNKRAANWAIAGNKAPPYSEDRAEAYYRSTEGATLAELIRARGYEPDNRCCIGYAKGEPNG